MKKNTLPKDKREALLGVLHVKLNQGEPQDTGIPDLVDAVIETLEEAYAMGFTDGMAEHRKKKRCS